MLRSKKISLPSDENVGAESAAPLEITPGAKTCGEGGDPRTAARRSGKKIIGRLISAAAAAAAGKPLPCPDYTGTDLKGCIVDPAFRHISAFNYFDFSARFHVNEHFELTFTVPNLFDKQPPIVGSTIGTAAFNSGNTYPSTYDPLGRRFAAGARIKF